MVDHRVCVFCGSVIEPGTGSMYVRRDGNRLLFCSSKCKKNLIGLKRHPRDIKWTESYEKGTAPGGK